MTTAPSTIDKEEITKPVRIRRYLLILLAIQGIVCILALFVRLYSVITENDHNDLWETIQPFLWILALIFYYLCGLFFVYKYHRLGILLFASIGFFVFAIICLLVSYIFFIIVALGVDYNLILGIQVFLVFFLIFGTFAGIVIATLKLAFNLAKLIKTHGYAMV